MHQDVIWRKPAPFAVRSVPSRLRPWLLDRGSLTRSLIKASQGRFRVEVIRQGWALPSTDERRALGMADRRFALVREVVLWGSNERWVYARSIIPPDALRGRYRRLRWLNNRPLGALLHSDVRVRRGLIETTGPQNIALDSGQDLHAWCRRSRYLLAGKPILVSEAFLMTDGAPWRQSSKNRSTCGRRQKLWCPAVRELN
ncbi:MAG: chorismate lyase, partial [Pseudomonadales bacterium]|nr:chorismate lyase [Pseudomonadales bacterium]